MTQGNWFLTVVIAVFAVNGGFFALAYSLPVHEEWLYYTDLGIPQAIATNVTPDEVQARLEAAGYNVTRETVSGDTVLEAAKPGERDYRAWISGLYGTRPGHIQLDVQCRTGYLHNDCPTPLEGALRARFSELLQDSGFTLDANQANFGDYDFATLDEFFLFLVQLFIAFVSVIVLIVAGAIYIGLRRRDRRALAQPYPPWSAPVAYGAPPPYPPPLQPQVAQHLEGRGSEPVGEQRRWPEQPQ